MHEPTNPLAESPNPPMRRRAEIARVASSQAPGGDMPGHSGGTAEPADSGNEKGCLRPQAPERIYGWLDSQMSIARFYGGLRYMGHSYRIAPTEKGMPLVREDVLQAEAKEKAQFAKASRDYARRKSDTAQWDLL